MCKATLYVCRNDGLYVFPFVQEIPDVVGVLFINHSWTIHSACLFVLMQFLYAFLYVIPLQIVGFQYYFVVHQQVDVHFHDASFLVSGCPSVVLLYLFQQVSYLFGLQGGTELGYPIGERRKEPVADGWGDSFRGETYVGEVLAQGGACGLHPGRISIIGT